MNEMVERVAMAIFWSSQEVIDAELLGPWELLLEPVKDRARIQARGAIEAMREPTVDMFEAGAAVSGGLYRTSDDTWHAMIEEALK